MTLTFQPQAWTSQVEGLLPTSGCLIDIVAHLSRCEWGARSQNCWSWLLRLDKGLLQGVGCCRPLHAPHLWEGPPGHVGSSQPASPGPEQEMVI